MYVKVYWIPHASLWNSTTVITLVKSICELVYAWNVSRLSMNFRFSRLYFGRQIIKALKRDGNMMLEWKKITLDSNRNDYCKSWSVTHQMMAETRRNWLTYELLYKKNLKGYIACNVVLKYTYHTTTPIVSGLKFMQLWYFALYKLIQTNHL